MGFKRSKPARDTNGTLLDLACLFQLTRVTGRELRVTGEKKGLVPCLAQQVSEIDELLHMRPPSIYRRDANSHFEITSFQFRNGLSSDDPNNR
jgi:hypothetical protein